MYRSGFVRTTRLAAALWFALITIASPITLVVCIGEHSHIELEAPHNWASISGSVSPVALMIGSTHEDCADVNISSLVNILSSRNLTRQAALLPIDHSTADLDETITDSQGHNPGRLAFIYSQTLSQANSDGLSVTVIRC